MSRRKGTTPTDQSSCCSEVESDYQATAFIFKSKKRPTTDTGQTLYRKITYDTNTSIQITREYKDTLEITISGKKEDVEEAKILIEKMEDTRKRFRFTIAEVRSKPEYHKFLIGRGGANIKKLRETTGAVIIIPNRDDADQETIRVKGFAANVNAAVSELEKTINELENTVEVEMDVGIKYHSHFLTRGAEVLNSIAKKHGGVSIRFPRKGVVSERVVIKGAKDNVEGAKKKIADIVEDLALQGFQLQVEIDPSYYYKFTGLNEKVLDKICVDHNVNVQFPDYNKLNKKNQNMILITGYEANTNRARDEILSIVNNEPNTIMVRVPLNYHQSLTGRDVRNLMRQFQVKISIPPPDKNCELVRVSGRGESTEWARKALEDHVAQLDAANEGKDDLSFQRRVDEKQYFHPKSIDITGYEASTPKASMEHVGAGIFRDVVDIEYDVHQRMIGMRGRKINQFIDCFKVGIEWSFIDHEKGNPVTFTITGEEDAVFDCREHMLNLEEEFMQDLAEDIRL